MAKWPSKTLGCTLVKDWTFGPQQVFGLMVKKVYSEVLHLINLESDFENNVHLIDTQISIQCFGISNQTNYFVNLEYPQIGKDLDWFYLGFLGFWLGMAWQAKQIRCGHYKVVIVQYKEFKERGNGRTFRECFALLNDPWFTS